MALITSNWTSIPSIQTDKCHWVSAGGMMALANRDNNILSGPTMLNLSEEEKQLIESLNLFPLVALHGFYNINCTPENSQNLVIVTAPLYIKEINGTHPIYRKGKPYVGTWSDPRDIQRICEFIKSNIPLDKISDSGCYVDI